MGPRVSTAELAERLANLIGPRASVARGVLDQHGQSESYYRALPPDIVVFPETTQEVADIVKLCASASMPIVPFGAGTSLEGNAASVEGGVCFDFARMNKVLAVHDSDMNVVVQPGIAKQLNAELRGTGLFFPIDPGADASIGMSSTRASGTMAVRYGTMKDNVGA
jgi:D-lactate dehydrogenase (cytochrome)